jgi:septum formation topological specificity factor MinE
MRLAAVLALLGALALQAVPAFAAPGATLEQKRAEQAATQAELEQMRQNMLAMVRDYVDIGRRMNETRAEIDANTLELAQLDESLADRRAAMSQRAVELYRGDRKGMIDILLTAKSPEDFLARVDYLVTIGARDMQMIKMTRETRQEAEWLQQHLESRAEQLVQMQNAADAQRVRIEADMLTLQARAGQLGSDIVSLLASPQGSEPGSAFLPATVVSESTFRDWDSMNAEQIQAFLNQQPGVLKSHVGPDYAGQTKSAAQMIADAAAAWRINPRVILATLQKEQSLLGRTSVTRESMDWAMGCGKADSYTAYQYQGFGKQIYWGAQKLDKNSQPWHPGITKKVDGSTLAPTNAATYSLYMYTPHFNGVQSFWLIYWRYFGDPLV